MACLFCDIKDKLLKIKNSLVSSASNTKASLDEAINNALTPAQAVLDQGQESLNSLIEKIKQKIESQANVKAKMAANAKVQDANKKESDNHDMQDAEQDIKWDPMTHLKVYYTNVKVMNPASYSNSQDYPLKRGKIDEQKNFETTNLLTGEWWRVHHTGYYQKVDGTGNYEEKIPGTAFYYTFGDTQISVEGNVDRVYAQNYYTYTMQTKTEDIDGDHFLNNNSNWFINTLISHNEAVGVMKNVTVGGPINVLSGANILIKAAGNITIQAGGVITLKGAKINLN
jgi:uncharacterized coiled-coil protein SlyX